MRIPVLLFITWMAAGCARSRAVYVPHTAEHYPAKSVDSPVVLTHADQLHSPYKEIGAIIANARSANKYEVVAELLKKKAREVGADAVIKVQYKQKQVFGLNPLIFSFQY